MHLPNHPLQMPSPGPCPQCNLPLEAVAASVTFTFSPLFFSLQVPCIFPNRKDGCAFSLDALANRIALVTDGKVEGDVGGPCGVG